MFFGLLLTFVCTLSVTSADVPADVQEGMSPIVLLPDDLLELKLNQEAIELMVAFSQDLENNSFLTSSEVEAAIREQLSALEGINEGLLDGYSDYFCPMIGIVKQKKLQQKKIDELISSGELDAAEALAPFVEQPIVSTSFKQVVGNILTEALVSSDVADADEESEKTQALSVEPLEKESDESFKAVVKEIVASADDSKSLLAKLLEFGKKINPIGKDFGALKKAKDERKLVAEAALATFNKTAVVEDDIQSDADVYENAMNILIRHIKDHQLNVISLKKKNKTEDADQEQFIVDELLKIYVDELARVENNKKIDKINEQIVALNQVAVIKAKQQDDKILSEKEEALAKIAIDQKENVARITDLVDEGSVEQIRYMLTLKCEAFVGLSSITSSVYESVQVLIHNYYLTVESLQEAVLLATAQLTEEELIGFNSLGDNSTPCVSSKYTESEALNKEYIAQLIASKAVKSFEASRLAPIALNVLPGCTSCSAPFKGTSYGFYPYWNASDEYSEQGLVDNRRLALDYSAFTNIAYFALPIGRDGKINEELHLKNTTLLRSFFETLTTYNVKRDIVLYSSDWVNWENRDGINVNEFAEEHYQFILDKHKQFVSWGGISGVTFYFDHYTNEQNVDQLVKYIKHFKTQMQTSVNGSDAEVFDINLLLGIEGLESQDLEVGEKLEANDNNYFAKLRDLILTNEESQEDGLTLTEITEILDTQSKQAEQKKGVRSIVDTVLVVMDEPTSPFKKRLRMQIESEFSGGERVEALLSVVPIMNRTQLLEAGEDSYIQFQDDIAYLKYNFGGMGLWNLPYTVFDADDQLQDTNTTMALYAHLLKKDYGDTEKNFIDYSKVGVVGQVLMLPQVMSVFDVCGEVCPKRDRFVWLFSLAATANCILWFLWRTHCKSRVIIKRMSPSWGLFQIGTVALFLVLLGCLPSWQENNGVILGSSVGLLAIFLGFTFLYGGYEKEV
jgi:hypothetical protein